MSDVEGLQAARQTVGGSVPVNAPVRLQAAPSPIAGDDDLLVAPSLEKRRLQCYLALILTDILVLLIGFGLAGYIYTGPSGGWSALVRAQVLLPIFLTIATYNGSYSIKALRYPLSGSARALVALGLSFAAVVFIAFYARTSTAYSRLGFSSGAILAGAMLIMSRFQMHGFVRWRCGASVINELVIDDGGPRIDIAGSIRISAAGMGLRADLEDPHALDRLGLVLRNIDRVVVSCPPERRYAWSMLLKGANVDGEVLDDQVVRLGAQGARVVGRHGLLMISTGPLGLRDRAIKRAFDFTLTGLGVLALSPLMVAIAIAVKLEDGGPVFFVQRRMGRGNCFFKMYKFRSMSVAKSDSDGNVSASKNDQRVTRVGRFIRSTSLDELPQLLNVLLGDMSLVGPRPHAIGSQAGTKLFWEVDLRYWQRHSLKPGLSGLAQVRGFRGATDHERDLVQRLQSDLEYLEGWTIWRDLKILLLTARVLVHDRAF